MALLDVLDAAEVAAVMRAVSLSVVALESSDTHKARDYSILLTVNDLTNAMKLLHGSKVSAVAKSMHNCRIRRDRFSIFCCYSLRSRSFRRTLQKQRSFG